MDKKVEVCIITLNWNGGKMTSDCLDSVNKNTKGINYKLILVDSASTDGSLKEIKRKYGKLNWLDILELKENKGFSGGNNLGIEYAFKKYNPDYYYFLSNDTKVTNSWLKDILIFAKQHPDVGMVGSKQFDFEGRLAKFAGNINLLGLYDYVVPKKPLKVGWLSGAAFLVKKDVIKKVGAFDEIFNPAYYEETDWQERTAREGYKIYTFPNSVIYHKGGGSEGSYNFNKYRLYYRNRAIFYMRHYKIILPIRMIFDAFTGLRKGMFLGIFDSYVKGFSTYIIRRDKIKTAKIK